MLPILRFNIRKRGAGIFTIDLVISIIIFLSAFLILLYYLNTHISSKTTYEIDKIAEQLLSEGIPKDWYNMSNANVTSIVSIGLLTKNKLDINKFVALLNLSYDNVKYILGVKSDFFFYFRNASSGIEIYNGTCGFGHTAIMPYNCSPLQAIQELNVSYIYRRDLIVAHPPHLIYLTLFTWGS